MGIAYKPMHLLVEECSLIRRGFEQKQNRIYNLEQTSRHEADERAWGPHELE